MGKTTAGARYLEAEAGRLVQGASHLSFHWEDDWFRVTFFSLSVMHRREETRTLEGGKWWWEGPQWKERQALIPREFGFSSATYKLTESQ